ncbi:MAG: U32 family peptidase [Anaeroplasma bactoclasticum]|nr:U32 family peptidase [Anaeroplasma bactoclasticum]MCM1556665.1 U32 family peptidase [Anaeroplasma bactoclasticum]
MVELLAPAGDLEKLKIAILYGADAVFIGGLKFSLRSRASNFTIEDIKEGCSFAHNHNAKIHVTCNIVMHEIDTEGILEYLKALEGAGVDAIIASSITILKLVIKHTKMEAHVSTQTSCLNQEAIAFYKDLGVSRVVLGRELTLEEIEIVKKTTSIDLEVFIHGGMCVSYSGRCMLSNNMTNRDANRGGCAHSCRWNYNLYQEDKKVNPEGDYFAMSSKDLCAIKALPQLMELGINSFKIEGRMKSLHYIATIVKTYRTLIDDINNKQLKEFAYYEAMMNKAENRLTSTGFLFGLPTIEEQLYDLDASLPNKDFVGIVLAYDKVTKKATIEQRNHFVPNSSLEVFGPHHNDVIEIGEVFDKDNLSLDAARHPRQIVYFYTEYPLEKNDLLRLN